MIDAPMVVISEALDTAVIRLRVKKAEMGHVMGPAMAELMAAVISQGALPVSPLFSHHFKMDAEVFDFEVGVAVLGAVEAEGRVVGSRLEARRVARTVYRGPYEGLGEAWGELDAWVGEKGLKGGAEFWEIYVAGPESSPDPEQWHTELNRALEE